MSRKVSIGILIIIDDGFTRSSLPSSGILRTPGRDESTQYSLKPTITSRKINTACNITRTTRRETCDEYQKQIQHRKLSTKPVLHCVKRKFGYLQRHFPLELCPKLRT